MIIVKPVGGLANRMRVIAASVQLAHEIGTTVQCIWESNNELGANYTDLFELSEHFSLRAPFRHRPKSSYQKTGLKHFIITLWNKMLGVDACYSMSNVDSIIAGEQNENADYHRFFDVISPLLAKDKIIFYTTGDYLADLHDVSLFNPVEEIRKVIESYALCFSNKTYGLHIRRTDNTWAIENSPLNLFRAIIESKIAEDDEVRFYLSTDDKETLQALKEEYGEHILIREKKYGRDSLDAMKDAVVDMWLLSKTQQIYGSYYSSFSEMAGLVGHIPVMTVKR